MFSTMPLLVALIFSLISSLAQSFSSLNEFVEHLAVNVDIVFPVIHGHFGEDGRIQVFQQSQLQLSVFIRVQTI